VFFIALCSPSAEQGRSVKARPAQCREQRSRCLTLPRVLRPRLTRGIHQRPQVLLGRYSVLAPIDGTEVQFTDVDFQAFAEFLQSGQLRVTDAVLDVPDCANGHARPVGEVWDGLSGSQADSLEALAKGFGFGHTVFTILKRCGTKVNPKSHRRVFCSPVPSHASENRRTSCAGRC